MTQRFAALRPGVNDSEPQIKSLHWVNPGSRLLRHFLVGLSAETTIAGPSATRQSGVPSRRWAIACRIDAPRHIEDEGPRNDFTRWVRLGARIGVATR